jgi:plastocyanin
VYKKICFGLFVSGLLTAILAACSLTDEAGRGGPQVQMSGFAFIQSSITINKGDTLTLVNEVSGPHLITNGSWNGVTPEQKTESGAPVVALTFNGYDSAPLGPFKTAGTFHFYCTLHQGMNLTVIVH